ncbi:hypothetical protein [uncultured Mediterranean phage uvMED]|jgi:hypothetical protein|nr:hypothetical protein [uncultured Mediterranean phage uvMED]
MWTKFVDFWTGLKRSVQLFLMGVGVIIILIILNSIF